MMSPRQGALGQRNQFRGSGTSKTHLVGARRRDGLVVFASKAVQLREHLTHFFLVNRARLVNIIDIEGKLELLSRRAFGDNAKGEDELVEVDSPTLIVVEYLKQPLEVRPGICNDSFAQSQRRRMHSLVYMKASTTAWSALFVWID